MQEVKVSETLARTIGPVNSGLGRQQNAAPKAARQIDGNPVASSIRSIVDYRNLPSGLEIDFGRPIGALLGLRLRKRQVRKCITLIASRMASTWHWDANSLRLQLFGVEPDQLAEGCDRIVLDLAALAKCPLTPRNVLSVLPITNKERMRWTKDGRLPQSGSVQIKRGQIVSIPTYDVGLIESLIGDLERIADWRRMDAAGR